MFNLELAPFPYAALLPPHLSSHVSSDSPHSFCIVPLFLIILGFVLTFIPLTFSAPFPMFTGPPTPLSYHTHVRTYSPEGLIPPVLHCKKHLHGKSLKCREVSNHTLLQRGTTSSFPPRKGTNLKSCPRTALLQSWGKGCSGAGWGLGCSPKGWVWMEHTHCQRGAPARQLLEFFQYLMSRYKLRDLESDDLLNSKHFQEAIAQALIAPQSASPISSITCHWCLPHATLLGPMAFVFWIAHLQSKLCCSDSRMMWV